MRDAIACRRRLFFRRTGRHRRRPAPAPLPARLDPERGARQLAGAGDDGSILAVPAPPPVGGHYGGRVGSGGARRERPRVHHAGRRAGDVDPQAHPRAGPLGRAVHRNRRIGRVDGPAHAGGQARYGAAAGPRGGGRVPGLYALRRRGHLRGAHDVKVDGAQGCAPVRRRHPVPARPRVRPRRERLVELVRDGKVALARGPRGLLGPGRVRQGHYHGDLPALVGLGEYLAVYPDGNGHVPLQDVGRLLDGQPAVCRLVAYLRPCRGRRACARARARRRRGACKDGRQQQQPRQMRQRRARRPDPRRAEHAHREGAAAAAKNTGGRGARGRCAGGPCRRGEGCGPLLWARIP